jgi:hypothetical protein
MTHRLAASDRLSNPEAVLTRTDLAELGYERRAVDAIFRACPVEVWPGYSRVIEGARLPTPIERVVEAGPWSGAPGSTGRSLIGLFLHGESGQSRQGCAGNLDGGCEVQCRAWVLLVADSLECFAGDPHRVA